MPIKSDRIIKQEPKHYGFPRTYYTDHKTELYPRRENTVSKISHQNENINSTEKLNPDYTKIVSNNPNNTNSVTAVTITVDLLSLNQKVMNMIKQMKKTFTQKKIKYITCNLDKK